MLSTQNDNDLNALTNKLTTIEKNMYQAYLQIEENSLLTNKEKIKESLTITHDSYKFNLLKICNLLQEISSKIFISVKITNVRHYKETDIIPDDYQKYLNASNNLTDLVKIDIWKKKNLNYLLICLERWITIGKLLYERNDFFSTNSILCAITNIQNKLIKLKLETRLSAIAQAILEHIQNNIFSKQTTLHAAQLAALKKGQLVIPSLSSLSAMVVSVDDVDKLVNEIRKGLDNEIEKDNDMEKKIEKEKKVLAKTISKDDVKTPYYKMQTALINTLTNSTSYRYEHLLEKPISQEDTFDKYANKHAKKKKIKINMDMIFGQFYSDQDKYYVRLKEYKTLCTNNFIALYTTHKNFLPHLEGIRKDILENNKLTYREKSDALYNYGKDNTNKLIEIIGAGKDIQINKEIIECISDIRIALRELNKFEEVLDSSRTPSSESYPRESLLIEPKSKSKSESEVVSDESLKPLQLNGLTNTPSNNELNNAPSTIETPVGEILITPFGYKEAERSFGLAGSTSNLENLNNENISSEEKNKELPGKITHVRSLTNSRVIFSTSLIKKDLSNESLLQNLPPLPTISNTPKRRSIVKRLNVGDEEKKHSLLKKETPRGQKQETEVFIPTFLRDTKSSHSDDNIMRQERIFSASPESANSAPYERRRIFLRKSTAVPTNFVSKASSDRSVVPEEKRHKPSAAGLFKSGYQLTKLKQAKGEQVVTEGENKETIVPFVKK